MGPDHAPSKPRVSKFLAAGVAVVGAGALAITPVSPVVDIQAQNRAVALTASANPTYSSDTSAVYGNLFNQTAANFANIFQTFASEPFPILNQVLANQWSYGEKIVAGFVGVPESFNSWWNGSNGRPLFEEAAAHFRAGEFADGWDRLNRSFVYALNIGSPLYNAFWSQAPSPRNPDGVMGIPEQMATNFQQVVRVIFDRSSIVSDITKNVLGPFLAMGFEFALLADAVTGALREGDGQAVMTALVNAPGVMLNSFLNGYVNPECEGSDCDQFPGLINASSALISIFHGIPKAIAEALKPDPVPGAPYTPPAEDEVGSAASALAVSNTVTLDVEPAAEARKASTETEETAPVTETETVTEEEAVVEEKPVTEEAPVTEEEPVTEEPVTEEPVTEEEATEEPVVEEDATAVEESTDDSAGDEDDSTTDTSRSSNNSGGGSDSSKKRQSR
ncbi:hypothetical protein CRI77_01235 [Mycolicibacterium duvalii]|nr:hypothetical protein CRI77_01235 [Mycolicibacterium duvalii]